VVVVVDACTTVSRYTTAKFDSLVFADCEYRFIHSTIDFDATSILYDWNEGLLLISLLIIPISNTYLLQCPHYADILML